MQYLKKIRCAIWAELVLFSAFGILWGIQIVKGGISRTPEQAVEVEVFAEGQYIKWVDFNVSYEALCEAYKWDVESWKEAVQPAEAESSTAGHMEPGNAGTKDADGRNAGTERAEKQDTAHVDWIELLAYVGTRHGGEFPSGTAEEIARTAKKLMEKETTMAELTKDMEYYSYYLEAYQAVLGGYVGEYEIQRPMEDGSVKWQKCYGLKAFSPVAKGFEYSDYDDFGASRSYGYARPHLGHDMMGQTGTPIIAIESGYVEAIGWNQYGGWRLGIRSFDGKRYYYYAHLRQNFPYCKDLEEGSVVTAGQVIGYMGHTGYSKKENVNNIDVTHLHWGLQLIFDESQKEGSNEIWIDCYSLTRFLYKNRSETEKIEETKEWRRVYEMRDPAVEAYGKKK